MITPRLAILLLLALSGWQAAVQEPPAAGDPEVSGPVYSYVPEMRPEKCPLRRERRRLARFRVSPYGELHRLEGFALDGSFISYAPGRDRDDDRGPPSA